MATLKLVSRRVYSILVEDRSFLEYLLYFFISVLLFGLLYTFMPEGHGVVPKKSAELWLDVFHGIYFSVVTITSLGYGDLRPEGVSRLFAGFQVVLGLTLIGLMITKLTSVRVSHLVSSLYASDVQRNLANFSSKFDITAEKLRNSFSNLAFHYQKVQVPTKSADNSDSVTTGKLDIESIDDTKIRFHNSVVSLKEDSREFYDYLSESTDGGRYLQLIIESTVSNLVSAVSRALSATNQSIVTLSSSKNSDEAMLWLAGVPSEYLSEIATMHKRASALIADNCQDDEIGKKCTEIDSLCNSISFALKQVPSTQEPDQLFRGDEPIG